MFQGMRCPFNDCSLISLWICFKLKGGNQLRCCIFQSLSTSARLSHSFKHRFLIQFLYSSCDGMSVHPCLLMYPCNSTIPILFRETTGIYPSLSLIKMLHCLCMKLGC